MEKVKFGLSSKPAPKGYRRIVNAFIVFVMPVVASSIVSIPETLLSSDWKIALGLGATVATSLFKGLEYFLSTEEEPKYRVAHNRGPGYASNKLEE